MLDGIQDRVAIVTGASRGIGRSIAIKLAQAGAIVSACATRIENLSAVEKELSQIGRKFSLYSVNLQEGQDIENVVKKVQDEYGRIDFLINNAGITHDGLILRMKEDEFDKVIQVNLRGSFLFCRAVVKLMIKQRFGRIVNISSVVGLHGNAGQINYSSAKAGLIGLTKSLAKELASRNILVNVIAPGFIKTDMTKVFGEEARKQMEAKIPLGFLGEPEDVAGIVLFLCSDLSRYVTGQVMVVDGGLMM